MSTLLPRRMVTLSKPQAKLVERFRGENDSARIRNVLTASIALATALKAPGTSQFEINTLQQQLVEACNPQLTPASNRLFFS
jgi:hypothetical protein